jgi:teichuronic acid biosynthesis glycosyltransferase TuaC
VSAVRVVVVAEYYPRADDPVLGVWAHRQAIAARDAGAEVRVLVLHRPLPPLSALRARDGAAIAGPLRQPRTATLDGIEVRYVRYLSPPRPLAYGGWGAWAAPALGRALRALRPSFPFDLVHAHYAVPAGDAVRRVAPGVPVIVSVHGGDVLATVDRGRRARDAVHRALAGARLVLANSADTARRCRQHGADEVRVVHLGTDIPASPATPARRTLVSVGHLVERKRHADVVRALAGLGRRFSDVSYVVVGDGPQREPLRALAAQLGVADRVELCGQLAPAAARATAREGALFVLPSVDEAFGVAYVEAMAAGVPAIGCRGEAGPEEIAAAGGGMVLVEPRDPQALAQRIAALLDDATGTRALGALARENVRSNFTWERCGEATLAAYREALR